MGALGRDLSIALVTAFAFGACADDPARPPQPGGEAAGAVQAPISAALLTGDVLLNDSFTRSQTVGWGMADVGGVWTNSPDAAVFSVNGSEGLILVRNGKRHTSAANSGSAARDVSGHAVFTISTAPDAAKHGHTIEVQARRVAAGTSYLGFQVRAYSSGKMELQVERSIGGSTRALTGIVPIQTVFVPGTRYHIRWEASGTSPALSLNMKVWQSGTAEPAAWQLSTTASEPALDGSGTMALSAIVANAQRKYPVAFGWDDVQFLGAPNLPPVAAVGGPYTGTAGSAVAFNGSGSSDPDGDLPLTYLWSFGDGGSATTAQPSHTYAADGTYTVALTVTDARGLSSTTASTTATIQPATSQILLRDSFSRTRTGGWGSAEVGGAWKVSSSAPEIFQVTGSEGVINAPNSSPYNVVGGDLQSYGMNVAGLASFSVAQAPDFTGRYHTIQVYARRDDRVSDGDNYYRYRIRAYGSGRMNVQLEKNVRQAISNITDMVEIPTVFRPDSRYWVRWEASGTSPATTVRMKVWADGSTEPAWQVSRTVNEPLLDIIGRTGFRVSAASDQTTFPVVFRFDDFEYRELGGN